MKKSIKIFFLTSALLMIMAPASKSYAQDDNFNWVFDSSFQNINTGGNFIDPSSVLNASVNPGEGNPASTNTNPNAGNPTAIPA